MGTNYYTTLPECTACKRPAETLHIGKSSGGWAFALHEIPSLGLTDWAEWLTFLTDKTIKDEYGAHIPTSVMIEIVTQRPEWQPGVPLRRADHHEFLVKHGDGTWDVVRGAFS